MRNVKVIVEYDGTDFFGFQRLPCRRTVQGTLEWALSRITKTPVKIVGAGRTDAGVHAEGQVISFHTESSIPTDRISVALNSLLPRDVVAKEATEASEDFHARYSANSRLYRYRILNSRYPSALEGRYSWYVPREIDVELMQEAANTLPGQRDFASFALSDKEERTTVRDLYRVAISRMGESIILELEANAFLRGMVRSVVGTLVEVGEGRRKPSEMEDILRKRNRAAAGKTAPPQGLCLVRIEY